MMHTRTKQMLSHDASGTKRQMSSSVYDAQSTIKRKSSHDAHREKSNVEFLINRVQKLLSRVHDAQGTKKEINATLPRACRYKASYWEGRVSSVYNRPCTLQNRIE